VHLSIFISVFNQTDAQNLFHNKFYFMPLHVSSTCAHHHTCRCDDTRGGVMQFWPPDDDHMCSKHVEAWNKLSVKQIFCASSWLITEIKKNTITLSLQTKLFYLQLCGVYWLFFSAALWVHTVVQSLLVSVGEDIFRFNLNIMELYKNEFHNFSSQNIRMIKSRKMRWAGK